MFVEVAFLFFVFPPSTGDRTQECSTPELHFQLFHLEIGSL